MGLIQNKDSFAKHNQTFDRKTPDIIEKTVKQKINSGKNNNQKLTEIESSSPNTSEIENAVRSKGREESDKIDPTTTQGEISSP